MTKQGTSSTRVEIRSELIEVVIPMNNGQPKTKIQLPDNQNLRNSHLMGIETYTDELIPLSIVTKAPVVPVALMQSIFLTLQDYNGVNFASQDPILDYVNMAFITGGTPYSNFPIKFAGQKVNYPKSYIEIADSTLISTDTNQVVLFKIYYRYFEAVERQMQKANFRKKK